MKIGKTKQMKVGKTFEQWKESFEIEVGVTERIPR